MKSMFFGGILADGIR